MPFRVEPKEAGSPDVPQTVTESAAQSGVTQFDAGAKARIAERGYLEGRIPDSIKAYLATTRSERLEEEVIDNRRLFYDRVAMDLPARPESRAWRSGSDTA
jgi:hypothetical protein